VDEGFLHESSFTAVFSRLPPDFIKVSEDGDPSHLRPARFSYFLEGARYPVTFHSDIRITYIASFVLSEAIDKEVLVSAMFDYYDRDLDGRLSKDELLLAQNSDHFEKLNHVCELTNMIEHSTELGQEFIDRRAFASNFGKFNSTQ